MHSVNALTGRRLSKPLLSASGTMRQLLALIALLTGLAAWAEPVRAVETGVENVSMAEGASCHAQASQMAVCMAEAPKRDCPSGIVMPLRWLPLSVPTVILQVDRAHE